MLLQLMSRNHVINSCLRNIKLVKSVNQFSTVSVLNKSLLTPSSSNIENRRHTSFFNKRK